MDNGLQYFVIGFTFFLIGLFLGVILTTEDNYLNEDSILNRYRKEAVILGYAEYVIDDNNKVTWKWLNEQVSDRRNKDIK